MTEIGPVQLVSIGFEPGANFEGRIVDELARLESDRTIRVLDLLFVTRDEASDDLVVLEHQEESMGAVVGALLGFRFDGQEEDEHAFGFSTDEIEQMGAGLEPGASAAVLLIEHVWARELKDAVRDAGGRMLGEGYLTPEMIAAVEPELVAIAGAIADVEREAASA
jgi:uncharacterized membrane protein